MDSATYGDPAVEAAESPVQIETPPAPPSAPPGAPASAGMPVPNRKRKGCLIALAVIVVLVLLGAIGAAIFISQLSKPEETGVTYSETDFDSVIAKIGVAWPELPSGANPDDYERVYSGEQPLDVTLTESELSALMSYRHSASYWPIKSMQVDLTGGNSARVSAVVSYAGRDWPVSAAGSGQIAGASLDVEVASASVTGFEVPAEYLPAGAHFLEGVVNTRLARIPGFGIDTFEVTDEGVHLVGTTWATAEYVKKP